MCLQNSIICKKVKILLNYNHLSVHSVIMMGAFDCYIVKPTVLLSQTTDITKHFFSKMHNH